MQAWVQLLLRMQCRGSAPMRRACARFNGVTICRGAAQAVGVGRPRMRGLSLADARFIASRSGSDKAGSVRGARAQGVRFRSWDGHALAPGAYGLPRVALAVA